MKEFNNALISEELIAYLNSCSRYIPTMIFEDINGLGEFGKILSECKKMKETLPLAPEIKEPIPLIYPQKGCIVGSDGASGGTDQMSEHLTCIFEDGTWAILERTSYGLIFNDDESENGESCEELYLTRSVFSLQYITLTETPLLNEIDNYFPDDYQGYWDI